DHVEGGGATVGKLDGDGLVVHDVVVAFPNATAVAVVGLQRGLQIGEGRVLDVFEAVPDVPFPAVGMVEVMLAGGVETVGLDRAVHETARAGAGRRLFGAKLEIAAEAGNAHGRHAA